MEAFKRERERNSLPANWPVGLTGPVAPGEDKLQALLTAIFLHEQMTKRRDAEEKFSVTQQQLAALIRLQKDIAGSADLDAVARFASFRALESMPAVSVAIALADKDGFVCRGSAGSPAPAIGTAVDLREGLLAECVRTAHLQLCYDTEADERVNVEASRALGVRSLVAVPIGSSERVLGVLAAFASLPRAFTSDHIALLETMAGMLNLRVSAEEQMDRVAGRPHVPPPRLSPEMAEMLLARSAPPPTNWTRKIAGYAFGVAVLLALAGVSMRGFIRREANRRPQSEAVSSRASHDPANSPAAQEQAEHTLLPTDSSPAAQRSPAANDSGKPLALPTIDSLRERATQGDADAQFGLGVKYAAGSGVRPDEKEAAKWFERAAAQGNIQAQQMLGDFYLLGKGVPKDLVKAYAWSSKAAAAGNPAAKSRVIMLKRALTPQQAETAEKLAAKPSVALKR